MKKLMSIMLLAGLLAACSGGDDGDQDEAAAETPEAMPEAFKAVVVCWSDTSLGCPVPGKVYHQTKTNGYRIQLKRGDKTYYYHAGSDMKFFLCEENGRQKDKDFGKGKCE